MSGDLLAEVSEFLVREATLLDRADFRQWLELVDPEIEYLMPVRSVRYGPLESEFSRTSFHYHENHFSLRMRVARLYTRFAWSEDPHSHYRHFVSNVAVDASIAADHVDASSNVLVYRGRGPAPGGEVLTAERRDRLRRTPDGLRLLRREVLLDQTVLPVPAITTFL